MRGKASRNGASSRHRPRRITVSSQSTPLKKASTAARRLKIRLAAQAASSRRFRPKAVSTRARPSTLERKWLSSTSTRGAQVISQAKRSGEDGVAPETSSMAPQARVRTAETVGATCSTAGLNSPRRRISVPRSFQTARQYSGLRPRDRAPKSSAIRTSPPRCGVPSRAAIFHCARGPAPGRRKSIRMFTCPSTPNN